MTLKPPHCILASLASSKQGASTVQTLVYHYDAFTTVPQRGNPAGIVLAAQNLSDTAMQRIAAQVGFNETTFVLPSATADVRLRFFTPGNEINLCGHATVASFTALYQRGVFGQRTALTVETKAGLLPIDIELR